MPVSDLHRQVAAVALAAAAEHGFALGGGNALLAHGVISRPTAMSAAGGSQRVAEGCAPVQDLTAGPPAQDRSCPAPRQQRQVI